MPLNFATLNENQKNRLIEYIADAMIDVVSETRMIRAAEVVNTLQTSGAILEDGTMLKVNYEFEFESTLLIAFLGRVRREALAVKWKSNKRKKPKETNGKRKRG